MRKGFTLLELLVVVVVIAILAAVGLPKLLSVSDKAKMSEGIQIANAFRSAQMNYYALNEEYAATCADLDLDYSDTQYFTVPTGTNCANTGAVTVSGKGDLADVTLVIDEDGNIACTATGAGHGTLCKIKGLN
ncbi:MAG: prepilin-type N-terminal cleavage/methylation domain-containing protein [Candidatus Omnitrophica bacterium]|nr:prepilin-type N-terminal cleavage/methylation domain-containing protein [Candidatus Omnitrophota bacterium]